MTFSKTILFFALSLCFIANTYSQNESKTIKVEVTDEKGKPINDVYVVEEINNNYLGATKNGMLTIKVSSEPFLILFSHVSYKKKIVNLEKYLKEGKQTIQVVLEKKSVDLNEVNISAEKNDLAYKNEKINVMDYEFYENSFLLLCGIGKNKELRLVDDEGKDLSSVFVSKKSKAIFKDCLNNLYLLFKDSVKVIQVSESKIDFAESYSRSWFESAAGICEAAIGQNVIIGREGEFNQEVNYFLKRAGTDEYQLFKNIINHKDQAISKGYKQAYERLEGAGVSTASANSLSQLNDVRKLDRSYTFYKCIISSPLFAPIFVIDNRFVLMDTYNGVIEWYSESGEQINSQEMNFNNIENWANLLLFDEKQQTVYVFRKDGIKKALQQLDFSDGTLKEKVELNKHPFAENYKIKDGFVYYLYRETHQPGLPRKLYKHRL